MASNYAVGGEVTISALPGRTPEETLRRRGRHPPRRLANRPVRTGPRGIAAADQMAREAQMELTDKAREVRARRRPPGSGPERAYGAIARPPSSQISAYA